MRWYDFSDFSTMYIYYLYYIWLYLYTGILSVTNDKKLHLFDVCQGKIPGHFLCEQVCNGGLDSMYSHVLSMQISSFA